MTTVVWKKPGVLACDKMATMDGNRYRGTQKLQVTKTHAYVVVGCLGYGLKMIKWIEGTREDDSPLLDHDETAVVAMNLKTGRCSVWEAPGVEIPVEDNLFATGSGGHIALGALAMGASAEEAVRAAAAWDDGTGFGVQVVASERALKPPRRKQAGLSRAAGRRSPRDKAP